MHGTITRAKSRVTPPAILMMAICLAPGAMLGLKKNGSTAANTR
jgi:hypothetical protein